MGKEWKAYLWRELHERRFHLLGLLFGVPISVALTVFFQSRHALDDPDFVEQAFTFALSASLVVFAFDLFGGDIRRGGTVLLVRLPAGMRTAFSAKIIAFFILSAATLAGCCLIALSIQTQYVWFFVEPKHLVYEKYLAIHQHVLHFFKDILHSLPIRLSLYLSSFFMAVSLARWMRKLGPAIALWAAYQLVLNMMNEHALVSGPEHLSLPFLLILTLQPLALLLFAYLFFSLRPCGFLHQQ